MIITTYIVLDKPKLITLVGDIYKLVLLPNYVSSTQNPILN